MSKELTANQVIDWVVAVCIGVGNGFLWAYGYEYIVAGWLCFKACKGSRS